MLETVAEAADSVYRLSKRESSYLHRGNWNSEALHAMLILDFAIYKKVSSWIVI